MKAAVLQSPGVLAVEDVATPEPREGELLLRVRDCGICGSDLHAAQALAPGTIFGHEFSGEVVEIGPGVSGWRAGDRAVSLPFFSCGECDRCRAGEGIFCPEIRGLGLGQLPGAYAELVRVQPANSLRVPDSVSDREAALVEPLAVGLHGVRRSGLRAGDGAVVLGAGPIGIATLLWANALGARTVVSEPSPGRRAMAEKLGAAAVVDPSADDPITAAEKACGGSPAVVFECVGVRGLIQQALTMAPLRARVVVLGVCMESDDILPLTGIMKELAIDFVLGYSKREFAEALEALASRRLVAAPMITDVVDLETLPAAFAGLRTPNAQCKVMIEPA